MPTHEIISNYGFPIFIACVFLAGLIYVLKRVFGKDGLAEKLIDRHIGFLDSLSESINNQTITLKQFATAAEDQRDGTEKIVNLLEKNIDLHNDSDSKFSTVHLHKASLSACRLIERVCRKLDIDPESTLEEIKAELTIPRRSIPTH